MIASSYVRVILVIATLISIKPLSLHSQSPAVDIQSIASKSFTRFTVNNGLPQSTINCMVVDKRGRIWVGTQDGAAYYNVRKWQAVKMPGKGNSNYILSAYCADDSSLYFGTNDGKIFRLKNDRWQSIEDSAVIIKSRIWNFETTIGQNGKKLLLIGTGEGLFSFNGTSMKKYRQQFQSTGPLIIYGIVRGYDQTIWIASSMGLCILRDSMLISVSGSPSGENRSIFSLYLDRDSSLWCGGDDVLFRLKNNRWKEFRFKSKGKYNPLRSIMKGSDEAFWIGGQNMTLRNTIDANDQLHTEIVSNETKLVYSIIEYPKGIFWIGTLTGLYRYERSSWHYLDKAYFPGGSAIYCIYEDSRGRYFFGTLNGLFVFSNGQWKKYDSNSGLKADIVYSIGEDEKGDVWIGTDGGGINILTKNGWRYIGKNQGLPSDHVYSIFKDSHGAMWISTSHGAVRFKKDEVYQVVKSDEFPHGDVAGVTEDNDGTIWIASLNGITQWSDNRFVPLLPPDGLPWGSFQCIYASSNGTIWCGTSGNGVLKYNPAQKIWSSFSDSSTPALNNNIVYGIREDKRKRVYFLTNNGVTRFTAVRSDSLSSEYFSEQFNVDDGLMNAEGNIGALFVDSKKRIWAGTIDGVSFMNPAYENTESFSKHLVFDNIIIKNMPHNKIIPSGVELSYDQNEIIFEYSLLSYFKESENTYQVQLTGLDRIPSLWTKNVRKEYTNLPEGSYTFRVWGKDFSGKVSEPIEYQFIINPPFWRTWWFGGMLILVVFGVGFISIRFFIASEVRKETERLERQQFIEHERTRISQDMHDEIGSSLTRISLLSEMVRGGVETKDSDLSPQDVIDKIMNIGDISRGTIDSINEIIWSINPRYDNLESLIQYMSKLANELLSLKNIQFELDLPNSIPSYSFGPEFRRNVFLIFKESLGNIVKHSRATFVRIVISTENNMLSFILQDNGVGIASSTGSGRSNKMGLGNMAKRAETVGGEVNIESEPGRGTRISFKVTNIQRHLI